MTIRTDDLRILDIKELATPEELAREYARTERASTTVDASRRAVQSILHGQDDRLIVVIGPCSIHDTTAALEYAHTHSLRDEPLIKAELRRADAAR